MLLETSRRYNPEIESITFLKDLSYNRDDFAKAGAALDRCFFLPCLVFFHLFIFHVAAGNSVCDLKLNEGFRTRAAFNRRIIAKKKQTGNKQEPYKETGSKGGNNLVSG